MHELSLCRHILSTVAAYSAKLESARISAIHLEIGMLAAVEKSALQFNFEVIKKNTLAEHAVLCFIDLPAIAFCDSCQKNVTITQYHDPCPGCGQFSLTITQGLELRIKSMEVA